MRYQNGSPSAPSLLQQAIASSAGSGAFRKYKRADGTPVNQLDLWMNTEKEGRRWGRKRNVTVLVKLG